MVYLFFLLLVLPFLLAVPQGVEGALTEGLLAASGVTRGGDLPVNTATKGVTSTTKRVTSTTKRATTTTSPPPKPTTTSIRIPVRVEVNCSDPSWVPTVDTWMKEEVDQKLKEWWESIPNRTSGNFVAEFGKAFGDFEHNLACGVDTVDQCVNPSCQGLFCILLLSLIMGCSNCFLV